MLVVQNIDLVERLATDIDRRYPSARIERDDLVGTGQVALVEVAGRYDPMKGDFRKYAGSRVRGAMLDAVRSSNLIGPRAHANGTRVALHSLDAPIGDHGSETLGGTIRDPGPPVEEIVAHREQLAEVMALPERERETVLREASGEHQAEIAQTLGVSSSRIGQLSARAKQRLSGDDAPTRATLTHAELEALRGAALGETVEETARRTRRAVDTVKSQRKSAMRRLNASSIAQAVYLAHDEIAA